MTEDEDLKRIEDKLVEALPGLVQGGGWAMPSEFIEPLPPLELPRVSVRRGGIRWPRFSVETLVVSRKRFLRRTRWELHIRYREGDGRPMHHYMEFTSESAAHNAEQIVKFMMSWINDSYHEEKEQRR